MPYHDPARPFVNYWYASCDGNNVESFTRHIAEECQDRLADEGGACIMYTHFAKGFCPDGTLNRRFRELMERLAGLGGWYVPTSTLLGHLLQLNGHRVITNAERRRLEWRWLRYKFRVGSS